MKGAVPFGHAVSNDPFPVDWAKPRHSKQEKELAKAVVLLKRFSSFDVRRESQVLEER
jgi:hypothetical protein